MQVFFVEHDGLGFFHGGGRWIQERKALEGILPTPCALVWTARLRDGPADVRAIVHVEKGDMPGALICRANCRL